MLFQRERDQWKPKLPLYFSACPSFSPSLFFLPFYFLFSLENMSHPLLVLKTHICSVTWPSISSDISLPVQWCQRKSNSHLLRKSFPTHQPQPLGLFPIKQALVPITPIVFFSLPVQLRWAPFLIVCLCSLIFFKKIYFQLSKVICTLL